MKRAMIIVFLLTPPAWAEVNDVAVAVSAPMSYATYYTVASCLKEGNSGVQASGIPLDDTALVCALPHRAFGGRYRVCRDSRCVVVTHQDYGPGRGPRSRGVVVDLSRAAFVQIAELREGKVPVTVERLRLENLEVMTPQEHSQHHAQERRQRHAMR